ncbi:MAG: hypothetical protein U9Q90_00530 [Campylobacterota bacterium]|nr:hypothetical protein [Campylobacterota bacterium]
MNKGLITFFVIGGILAYLLTGFIDKLQKEDDRLLSENKIQMQEDMKYYKKDAVGNLILVFRDIPETQKIAIWKRSPMYQEMLNFFPDFSEMKAFVDDRIIVDDSFKQKLTKRVKEAEDGYFSGTMTDIQVKEYLDSI